MWRCPYSPHLPIQMCVYRWMVGEGEGGPSNHGSITELVHRSQVFCAEKDCEGAIASSDLTFRYERSCWCSRLRFPSCMSSTMTLSHHGQVADLARKSPIPVSNSGSRLWTPKMFEVSSVVACKHLMREVTGSTTMPALEANPHPPRTSNDPVKLFAEKSTFYLRD